MVANLVRSGKLVSLACEHCGADKTQAHHEDYLKPLEVVWLCTKCHAARHIQIKSAIGFIPKPGSRYVPHPLEYPKDKLAVKAAELRAEGLSYSGTAEVLGVTKGTVYKWLNNVAYIKRPASERKQKSDYCKNGHLLTPDNIVRGEIWRKCKTCHNEAKNLRRALKENK